MSYALSKALPRTELWAQDIPGMIWSGEEVEGVALALRTVYSM